MAVATEKAASIYGPRAAATPSSGALGNNVVRLATSATSTSAALATASLADGRTVTVWAGKWVSIKNEDSTNGIDVAFSPASQALVYGQVSTFGAGNAACGWRLGPGEKLDVIVPPDSTYFNFVQPSGAAAATIALYCSEGPAVIR